MRKLKILFRELLSVIIPAIIIVVILRFFIFPCAVEGRSMNSTLHDGDRGFSFKICKQIKINRFDIVVIDTGKKLLVKRVIGLPNDEVEYKDNCLYINGDYLQESFLDDVNTEDLQIKLNDNEYYCLGDNRDISLDSRYYGAFKSEDIVSTHYFTIYPFENFGFDK